MKEKGWKFGIGGQCLSYNEKGRRSELESIRLKPKIGTFTPLESPAASSGDDGCSFFSEHGV
jgi:hypothetical protein